MTANLTRDTARHRSRHLNLDTIEVWLDITGAVDPEQLAFPSRSTLRFTSTTDRVGIDFLDGEVDAVQVNGLEVPVDYDGATVRVTGLRTDGATNEVTISGRARYSRSGQGLHRFTDPADGQTFCYTQYEPTDSRRVYAQFDQPDLKARHTFHVDAPTGWTVLSNQPATVTGSRHDFAETPPLSTYITVIVAGPYHGVTDSWTSADATLTIPLGLWCRASRADTLDATELFRVTKLDLDFFHENFAYPYPWGKYDQVFVPEYNLGAMENPGCVTFTEQYLFRSVATRAQFAGRANTIAHEMSHMWFGDLVTPRWWDELWLKESFAEFMGSHATAEAAGFPEAWVSFAGRRKAWAYAQDELPTTHPIAADIPDVEAAKQNFDGITYAKGAAVLKQLVHHVGVEAFFAGARKYFVDHAFGATEFADLVTALETASGRDLSAWTHAWLETAGPDTLTGVLEVGADNTITRAAIEQVSLDAITGEHVGRPHTLAVGLYDLTHGLLTLRQQTRMDLDGTPTADETPGGRTQDGRTPTGTRSSVTDLGLVGQPAPDLMLVNDADWTYAKVVLDPRSLATALAHLPTLADPLARALLWSQLWSMVRDALLPVADYVAAVERHGPGETDAATLTTLLANAHAAIENFLPPQARPAARADHLAALGRMLDQSDPGSDTQLILARAVARQAAVVPDAGPQQATTLAESPPDGLEVGPDLRWSLLQARAATDDISNDDLATALAADDTLDGSHEHLTATAARPDANTKRDLLFAMLEPGACTNAQVDAIVAGLNQPLSRHLLAPEDSHYFDQLARWWQRYPIEIAQRLVGGLFPPPSEQVVEAGAQWLAQNPDSPRALRRLVHEETDLAARALRAQAANSTRAQAANGLDVQ
ncbi:aminopeptidase N [Aestuariimicrobium sp. Y1814]|uniref:aminopeptidase N n=1 Tax=Aestuariimicrobium sp. Y1814 TaxID=3418742 RepID=UPI003DA7560D